MPSESARNQPIFGLGVKIQKSNFSSQQLVIVETEEESVTIAECRDKKIATEIVKDLNAVFQKYFPNHPWVKR